MAAKELTETLLNPIFPSPLPPIGDVQYADLKTLAKNPQYFCKKYTKEEYFETKSCH